MSDKSGIEWTDATWNPATGCTEVSPGCGRCYAKTFAERFRGTPGHHFERGFDLTLRPERLDQPLRWKRPRRIFVNSMSDLFHDHIPDDFIARVFAVMAVAEQHTFQVLTKRHARMRSLLTSAHFQAEVQRHAVLTADRTLRNTYRAALFTDASAWPLRNVWLGVSVEDQKWADIRIPALLQTAAAVRWISAEPLLGPLSLTRIPWPAKHAELRLDALGQRFGQPGVWAQESAAKLDWVVLGGESGPGARPMLEQWARDVRRQCEAAGVPFLFKQWGAWAPSPNGNEVSVVDTEGHEWKARMFRGPKAATGRVLDGRTWDEYPAGAR